MRSILFTTIIRDEDTGNIYGTRTRPTSHNVCGEQSQKCGKVTDVQKAMKPLTDDGKPLYNSRKIDTITGLRLPVAISYSDQWPRVYTSKTTNNIVTSNPYKTEDNETKQKIMWHGNILTVLYPQREDSKDIKPVVVRDKVMIRDSSITLDTLINDIDEKFWPQFFKTYKHISSSNTKKAYDVYEALKTTHTSQEAAVLTLNELPYYYFGSKTTIGDEDKIKIVAAHPYIFHCIENLPNSKYDIAYRLIRKVDKLKDLKFISTDDLSVEDDIRTWGVMSGTESDDARFMLLTFPPSFTSQIHNGDELLYLKADRMFVNDSDGEQNFCFQTLKDDWSDVYPHEKGILGIYFQLDIRNNILDLWVLATGGKDDIKHNYPAEWAELKNARPTKDQWEKNCPYEITYVSHASWKLHNIPEGFNWTN